MGPEQVQPTTPGQSEPESNGNRWELYTPQIARTGVS